MPIVLRGYAALLACRHADGALGMLIEYLEAFPGEVLASTLRWVLGGATLAVLAIAAREYRRQRREQQAASGAMQTEGSPQNG